jgi:putative hydrolase of the HAD superfamily
MVDPDNGLMKTKLRAVSLDLDNTLWDTPPVLARAEAALASWLAVHAPQVHEGYSTAAFRELRSAIALAHPDRSHDMTFIRSESLRYAVRETGVQEAIAEQAFEVFLAERNRITLFDEAPAVLAQLCQRLPVYALTNGNACVHRVGIGHFFAGSLDAAGVGAAKPDALIFEALVRQANTVPGAILHVGDDALADVEGGRLAGLRTVWMNRNRCQWPAELIKADYEIADLNQLLTIVDALV